MKENKYKKIPVAHLNVLTKSIPLFRALIRSSSEPVQAKLDVIVAPPSLGALITASMTPSSFPRRERLCALFSGEVRMGR